MVKQSKQQSRRTAAQMHALAAVQREIRSSDSVTSSKYLREFTDAFQKYQSTLRLMEVEEETCKGDVVLIGDYHALPASQRFAAEVLEKYAQQRPVVLGLEAVLARDQKILDAWWRREIPEEELRRRLRFDREWGYQWEPVYQLLSSARDHAEAIYGLDCMPRADMRRIRSRDRHAAAKLRDIRQRHPDAAVLVLFGESHMAPQHLPRLIGDLLPQQKIVTVLQNLDALYWQAVSAHAAAVQIQDNVICVFNSSPLEKYESYRLCLERWNATQGEQQDFAPAVYNLIFSLARALGFRLDSPCNGIQPRYLADSLPEIVSIEEGSASVASKLEEKTCAYFADSNYFAIREFQMADAAEECTRFLHSACRGKAVIPDEAQPIEDALARFGARLLCPEIEAGDHGSALGDSLYNAYVAGKVSRHDLRRIFLSHLETFGETLQALVELENLARA
ncbi:MAG TPA: ChaN family lipoprotein [Terriglobales bacterium]